MAFEKGSRRQAAKKKTVTEWLAGIQYEERKPTGTKWVKVSGSTYLTVL